MLIKFYFESKVHITLIKLNKYNKDFALSNLFAKIRFTEWPCGRTSKSDFAYLRSLHPNQLEIFQYKVLAEPIGILQSS